MALVLCSNFSAAYKMTELQEVAAIDFVCFDFYFFFKPKRITQQVKVLAQAKLSRSTSKINYSPRVSDSTSKI